MCIVFGFGFRLVPGLIVVCVCFVCAVCVQLMKLSALWFVCLYSGQFVVRLVSILCAV